MDKLSKTVHDVLFTAHQCLADPDFDDEADPATDGPEFEANVTDLHQSGRHVRLGSRTHSNSNVQGAL